MNVSPIQSLPVQAVPDSKQALAKAAQGFEAIFLRQILKEALPQNSGPTSFYDDVWINCLSDSMAKSGGLGLAQWMVAQGLKNTDPTADNIGE